MKSVVLASLFLLIQVLCYSQDVRWQQSLRYNLSVTLDDRQHALEGQLKLAYVNHSPDTLQFIWFHIWPNAYRNDRTVFSEQLLENGETAFYFSSSEDKGYMNGLDFRINGASVSTESLPSNIDILKLMLPSPLLPGDSIMITTPFHVKLPHNFSRGGHRGQQYTITQWYPKPAVYDHEGWHPMPYLDQGEFYSDFGTYDVEITLPMNYVVAATGMMQEVDEKIWMLSTHDQQRSNSVSQKRNKKYNPASVSTSSPVKTLHFHQDRIHDFAWFADEQYIVKSDTLKLHSGRIIEAYSYHHPEASANWVGSLGYVKSAVRLHSQWIGEYPYEVISVVEGIQGDPDGMEYPTISFIHDQPTPSDVEKTIFHEVGHNWFYGILANNERQFPWMDEGINTYYDNRYAPLRQEIRNPDRRGHRLDEATMKRIAYQVPEANHLDQPINTPADLMEVNNYAAITYEKTGVWLKGLESKMGQPLFDSAMHTYFQQWQFRHPYPEDLKRSFSAYAPEITAKAFEQINRSGPMYPPEKKKFKVDYLLKLKDSDKYNYMFIAPVIGYNLYDGIMPGLLIHNYNLPPSPMQYAFSPVFGLSSKKLNGVGRLSWKIYPKGTFRLIEWSLSGSHFSMDEFTDTLGKKWDQAFTKFTPGIKLEFRNKNSRSSLNRFLQYKLYLIGEDQLDFRRDTILDREITSLKKENIVVHQFTAVWEDKRTLYPYRGELRFEANKGVARFTFTGNYFFNFRKKGGVSVRLFAGKFFYLSARTSSLELSSDRFQLNMTGPKGYEDYTYSNYFMGRNAFDGFYSQQIMERDGFFKVRTDLLSDKLGRSDNWLSAMNLVMDIPDRFNPLSLLPLKIPLKLFADVGASSSTWDPGKSGQRMLFDGGLQFSLFHSTCQVFVPLVYSKAYRDYFKSTPGNNFLQRISFSIDLQHIPLQKWMQGKFDR